MVEEEGASIGTARLSIVAAGLRFFLSEILTGFDLVICNASSWDSAFTGIMIVFSCDDDMMDRRESHHGERQQNGFDAFRNNQRRSCCSEAYQGAFWEQGLYHCFMCK